MPDSSSDIVKIDVDDPCIKMPERGKIIKRTNLLYTCLKGAPAMSKRIAYAYIAMIDPMDPSKTKVRLKRRDLEKYLNKRFDNDKLLEWIKPLKCEIDFTYKNIRTVTTLFHTVQLNDDDNTFELTCDETAVRLFFLVDNPRYTKLCATDINNIRKDNSLSLFEYLMNEASSRLLWSSLPLKWEVDVDEFRQEVGLTASRYNGSKLTNALSEYIEEIEDKTDMRVIIENPNGRGRGHVAKILTIQVDAVPEYIMKYGSNGLPATAKSYTRIKETEKDDYSALIAYRKYLLKRPAKDRIKLLDYDLTVYEADHNVDVLIRELNRMSFSDFMTKFCALFSIILSKKRNEFNIFSLTVEITSIIRSVKSVAAKNDVDDIESYLLTSILNHYKEELSI